MRKPLFLEGVEPIPSEPLGPSDVESLRIRTVAWTPSPAEPALSAVHESAAVLRAPEQVPPPPPSISAAPHFEPLQSEPSAQSPGFPLWAEERLKAAIDALRAQGERLAEQARADALELGLLIARRIVERELSTNLDSVFALVKSAIRRAGEEHVTRVRLSPHDAERFERNTRSDLSLGTIDIEADPNLSPGDVMVDTEHHSIDGRLHTRFEEVARQLDGEDR